MSFNAKLATSAAVKNGILVLMIIFVRPKELLETCASRERDRGFQRASPKNLLISHCNISVLMPSEYKGCHPIVPSLHEYVSDYYLGDGKAPNHLLHRDNGLRDPAVSN